MRRILPLSLFAAVFLIAASSLPAAAVELHLEAEIAKGAKQAIKQPVEWSVTRMFNDKKPGEAAATARESVAKLQLEPGIYLVSAKLGLAKAEQTVELTKAPVSLRLNLNAGIVRLSMIPHAGAPMIKDNVHWELFPYTRGGGTYARAGEANAPTAEFILPAGGWVARATYDGTMSELVIPLEAGQTFNYTLNLYAGKAKVTAAAAGGGTFKDPVMWEIVRAGDRNDLVASMTAPSHQFTLREGSYVVLARQGTFAGEAPLEVKAGNTATVKVTMSTITAEQAAALESAAKKRVELAQAALAPKPAAQPAATKVAAAGTSTRTLAETLKSAEAKPQVAQAGAAAQATAEAPAVAAAAPATQTAALAAPAPASTPASGTAKVVATGKSGKAFKDPVVWEVVATADSYKLIASATAPTTDFTLPAGRYVLLAQQGTYAGQAPLDVTAGATAEVKVKMSRITAEQAAALEQASEKRVALAEAAKAAAAQVAASAPEPAPTTAPAGAAESLRAADAAAQPATPALQPSTTRTLAETLKAADELRKAQTAAETATDEAPEAGGTAEANEAAEAAVASATEAAAAPAEAASAPAAEVALAAVPAATDAAPAADQPEGSVKVAAWSKKVDQFRDAVEWEIRRVQPSGAVLPELVASHKAATHEFMLPAGSYVIWGRQGTLIGKQKFDVEPDGTVAIRVFMQTPKVAGEPGAEAEEIKSASSGG